MENVKESWWSKKCNHCHQHIVNQLNQLDNVQSVTRARDKHYLSLYSNRRMNGLQPGSFTWSDEYEEGVQQAANLNLSRSVVDSSQARICPNKPRVRFLTEGGNWFLQERARGMQRFYDGWMSEVVGYKSMEQAALDCKVFNKGYVHLMELDDRLEMEHVFKPEITVDEQAAATSPPRTAYRRKLMAAEFAVGKYAYPKGKYSKELGTQIYASGMTTQTGREAASSQLTVQMVEVIEAIHLPSRAGAKDGRRVVCVDNATLVDEAWELDCLPWVEIEWADDTAGYYKPGLVEETQGLQEELTKLIQEVQSNFEMLGGAHIRTAKGSVPPDWVDNERYKHFEGDAGDWDVITPSPVNPVFLQYIEALIAWGYDFPGVSKMEATSSQPGHQLSGKAIREYRDNASGRFAMKERAWERFGLAVARTAIKMMRRIAQRHPNTEMWYQSGSQLERVSWADIELPENDYRLDSYPTSMLPKEPSAKVQTVQEWVGAGMISGDEALQLLDFPDVESSQNIKLAALKHAQWVMDSIVYKRKVIAPDPIMDLPTCIKWARGTYLYVQMHGGNSDDKKEREKVADILKDLGAWILGAKALIEQETQQMMSKQAAMMPPPPPGGAPGGEVPLAPGMEPPPMATGGAGVPPALA